MLQRYCRACKKWHPSRSAAGRGDACPYCLTKHSAYNPWLRHAALDSHLFGMQEKAVNERRIPTRSG